MPFFIVTVVVAALLQALGLAEEDLVPFSVEEVGYVELIFSTNYFFL